MTTQLNVKLSSDLKQAFKFKCEIEGVPMEVALTNLLADFVEKPEFKVDHVRVDPTYIPPLEPTPGWSPSIDGISFSRVDVWLSRHGERDTNILEVWTNCFQSTVRRMPNMKEIKMIGVYLQRSGWSKTPKVSGCYRVNRLYGRSVVFVKVDDASDLLV